MPESFVPPSDTSLLRILDAAANRGAEGLRVVEDYVRFVLDDRHLTVGFKRLRHDLADALLAVPGIERHHARDTEADVGTDVSTPAEQSRCDTRSVCAANFKRLQQSLRSLEEYGKIHDPALAARFEALRYQSYTLERAVDVTRASLERLAGARLYVLVDGDRSAESFLAMVQGLVHAGVHLIQLRDKTSSDRELAEYARLLVQATRESPTLAIINDRPDVAALAQADGVHVGQDDLGVKDARAIVGPQALVGVSTHTIDQARAAVLDGADYLGVGPTFPSQTKVFEGLAGLPLVSAVAAEIRLPAFALGGVSPQNVAEVRTAGLHRVAVGAAITRAADPAAAATEILRRLQD